MAKTLTISVPDADYEFVKYALDSLAADVITSEEAGQRGARRSVMIRMIASAYIGNITETAALVMKIKQLTD